jgi:hypothetical protein
MKSLIFSAFTIINAFMPVSAMAIDPGKPDLIIMDSIAARCGQLVTIGIRIRADDTTLFNNKEWRGVGSFCIPLKYDKYAFTVDSIKFRGVFLDWDEKFNNAKIDTGFISMAGIYNIAGAENPPLFSPDSAQEVIRLFLKIGEKTRPGNYFFALTSDPIQKELYFGSIDGMHSWKPAFIAGKITVK